jgi:pimeloyl-ACP methyl ester carboxylesterase
MGRPSVEYNNFAKQTPSGDFWQEPLPRRGFFRRVGQIAVTVALADTLTGEMIWDGTNPEIHTIDNPEAKRLMPDTYTLVCGGFNVSNFEGLGEAVDAISPGYGPVAYLEYPDGGISINDIVRTAREFIHKNKVKHLRLYGHSMGGMIAVEVAAQLKDEVEVEAIFLDCTPASDDDIRERGQLGTFALATAYDLGLSLGPATRFVVETVASITNGDKDYLGACRSAADKVTSNKICSNKLVESEGSIMRTFKASNYKDRFDRRTVILRLRPADYGDDKTVNNETSLPRWREGLNHAVHDVPIRGSGHADPGQRCSQYKTAFLENARRYDLPHERSRYPRLR